MDKSIDDKLIRDAREDGAARERVRIKRLLEAESQGWLNGDSGDVAYGARLALSEVLCRIDGLLPARGEE